MRYQLNHLSGTLGPRRRGTKGTQARVLGPKVGTDVRAYRARGGSDSGARLIHRVGGAARRAAEIDTRGSAHSPAVPVASAAHSALATVIGRDVPDRRYGPLDGLLAAVTAHIR